MAYQKTRIIPIWIFIALFISSFVEAGEQEPQVFDINEDSGFYYTIQKGDTLWDLSQKFYESQWEWPGLWEMNKDIKNPHWIYPGNKIRVYLKPDTRQKFRSAEAAPEQETVQAPQKITPTFNYTAIDRIGFIKEEEIDSLGTIIRERDGNLMMSANDIIYIKPAAGSALVPEERYQVFTTEPVNKKFNKKRFKGIKHIIKAEIEVLEATEQYAKALITTSFKDATVGDRIMAFYEREPMLPVQETPPPIDAVIISSEDNTLMVNDYRIAFIDKGKNDDIRPGQMYDVFQTQEKRSAFDGADAIVLDPLNSGRLIVLHTEDISATVMILSSKRDIHPGDMVN
ncbi:MAG: LysM peptidoglycan-binding domain-containing protein [Desulfobacterales bacterium]|nr:LysM peptidoglycan-binding domain-containing protein [Desulfobacterales bacterium]